MLPKKASAAKELGALGCAMSDGVAAGDCDDLKTVTVKMARVEYTSKPKKTTKRIIAGSMRNIRN